MDGRRAAPPPVSRIRSWHADDESELGEEELGVFTAERYFNGALGAEEALWCDRSSSSLSSVFKTWQHDGSAPTPTAATSSSEASWNSRSALLPNRPAVAAPSPVESKSDSRTESDQTGRKARPSSSHLRRWLLGMAGRACAWGDGEESVSTDDLSRHELEAGSVHGGQKRSPEADAALPRMTSKQTAVEDGTTVRVMSGKRVDDRDAPPVTLLVAEATHGRAANSGELSMRMMDPAANASYNDRLRRESSDMFHQAGEGSAITIVAGSTAQGGTASAGGGARGSPDSPNRRRDSGDLESMYTPSEASVVWSVVTAEGAASGNFSSAASGCYYYCNDGDGETTRHMAAGGKINRRRRSNGSRLLMGCMSKRAVDAVGSASDVCLPAGGRAGAGGKVSGPDVTRRR